MDKLPKKIEQCPIKEAVLEIRFASDYPPDAIFGVVYSAIKNYFTEKPQPLPILQIPEQVRLNDPNLKYQPYHKIPKENMVLNIGPKVLTFINLSSYSGWSIWSGFFYEIIEQIIKIDVLNKIERFGLRYINMFDENIFNKVKLEIKLVDKILNVESTHLRTEICDNDFVKILQIGNAVNLMNNNKTINGSIIDIDCLYSNIEGKNFSDIREYKKIIEAAHVAEKKLFFSLLTQNFMKELKPIYGE